MNEKPKNDPPIEHQALPVAGYKSQNQETVDLVNRNKQIEEKVLRYFDQLAQAPDVDKRWLAIGRTAIEQGFMAMNRSIFKPDRIKLEPDANG